MSNKANKAIIFLGTFLNYFSYFLLTKSKSYGSAFMQDIAGNRVGSPEEEKGLHIHSSHDY